MPESLPLAVVTADAGSEPIGGYCRILLAVDCPYCGGSHVHHAKQNRADTGQRESKCGQGSYLIVGTTGSPSATRLAFEIKCPTCHAAPGERCNIHNERGYHLTRGDRAIHLDMRR